MRNKLKVRLKSELTIQNKRFKVGELEYTGKMDISVLDDPGYLLVVLKNQKAQLDTNALRDRTLKTLFETGMDAVLVLNASGSIIYLSPNTVNLLGYTEDAVVATDFRDETCTSVFDATAGIALDETFVKLVSWYDNEWGYSKKCLEMAKVISK